MPNKKIRSASADRLLLVYDLRQVCLRKNIIYQLKSPNILFKINHPFRAKEGRIEEENETKYFGK